MALLFKKSKNWVESKRFLTDREVLFNKSESESFRTWAVTCNIDVERIRMKYINNIQSSEVFQGTFGSLTSGVLKQKKTAGSNNIKYIEFHNYVLNQLAKDVHIDKKESIYTPKDSAQIFGTFVAEFIPFLIDEEGYKRHFFQYIKNHLPGLDFDQITEMWKYRDEASFWEHISILVTLNRSKSSEVMKRFFELGRPWIKRSGENSIAFSEDYAWAMKNLTKEVEKIKVRHKNFVLNPVFGSNYSGLKADGDLIIDNSLVEIKCSKRSILIPALLEQLIGYVELNENLGDKKHNVIKNVFYLWNPLCDLFEEIVFSQEKIDCAINLFKMARLEYVNFIRKKVDYPQEFTEWREIFKSVFESEGLVSNQSAKKMVELFEEIKAINALINEDI